MINLTESLERLPVKIMQLSQELAVKEADYKNLEDRKKTLLAHLINIRRKLHPKGSVALLETLALDTEEFGLFLDGLCAARKEYLIAKAQWESINAELDILRSLNSRSTAELKIL